MKEAAVLDTKSNFIKGDYNHMDQYALCSRPLEKNTDNFNINNEKNHIESLPQENEVKHPSRALCFECVAFCCCCCFNPQCIRACETCREMTELCLCCCKILECFRVLG